MNYKALKFRWDGAETRRYHCYRPLMEDTVGHHSHNVISIILAIAPDASRELILAAHDHDAAEHITGDMPAPTKRSIDGLRDAFGKYETKLMRDAELTVYEYALSEEELITLKLADALDGMRYCLNEVRMGNSKMQPVFSTFSSYVENLLASDNCLANANARELHSQLCQEIRFERR